MLKSEKECKKSVMNKISKIVIKMGSILLIFPFVSSSSVAQNGTDLVY